MNGLGQLGHGRVLAAVHKDDTVEEVTKQHGHQRNGTNHHRGNRQQHQGQRHHPGRFMRLGIVAMVVVVMCVAMVCIRVLVVTLLAVEHDPVQTERIESGDEHPRQHSKVGKTGSRQGRSVYGLDDGVLGVKTREERRTDQRQIAQQEGDPGNGHVLAHTAHPADILVVVHAHDDRASPEEQQRFEESVRHQVEHRHRVGRGTQRHRHVAQLRQRGVGNHALDVVLDDAQDTHKQGRNRTDHQDEVQAQCPTARYSGDMRDTIKIPAVTMVAAWISAEIGVGPSIESGSQACSGNWADLPMAPMNKQMPVTVNEQPARAREACVACQLVQLGEDFAVVQRTGVGSRSSRCPG